MIVEIIQASVGIVYPSRKEDVVKTCNTRRLFEELGCLLPCSVIHWCCVAVHIHCTHNTQVFPVSVVVSRGLEITGVFIEK